MKKLYLLSILAAGIFTLALMWNIGYNAHTPKKTDFSVASEQSQLDYVNKVRADNKLPALAYDEGLQAAAKDKVADMIARDYWEHDTPDGQPFYTLLEKDAPNHKYYGENLGKCFTSNKALFDAYVASPEHLANILNPHYSLFGAATLWQENKKCFINANEFGG